MKSCPFCGAKADLMGHPGDPSTRAPARYSVRCSQCAVETDRFLLKDTATVYWDARSGLADASPLTAWIDLHSQTIVHTVSPNEVPQIHGFSLRNPDNSQREFYRLCSWKLLSEYFRDPK